MGDSWEKGILFVDLSDRSWGIETLKCERIGGSSLARELLLKFGGFAIVPGLLTGTEAPTGGRYSMALKTRHGVHVSSVGGFIGSYVRGYQLDGIVTLGRSEEPLIVYFRKEGIAFESASQYTGKGALEVQKVLEVKGRKSIVVGPAGEKEVGISSLIAEGFRSFGRGAGEALWRMGVKALVFDPAPPPKVGGTFREIALKLKRKLRASSEGVNEIGHPCYGCPISCAAMDGKLKKGISRILRDMPRDRALKIVKMANDAGVDLFGAWIVSREKGMKIEEVVERARTGEDFDVEYPEKERDDLREWLDDVGLCRDAAELLSEEDVSDLVKAFDLSGGLSYDNRQG